MKEHSDENFCPGENRISHARGGPKSTSGGQTQNGEVPERFTVPALSEEERPKNSNSDERGEG